MKIKGCSVMNPPPFAEGETKPQTVRLFFALWPDVDIRSDLEQLSIQMHALCGGRRTRAEAIHITLAFLGDIPVKRAGELCALAAQLQCNAFDCELTQLGWWHNRIAWVAPVLVPQAMTMLVRELQCRLKTAGFEVDVRAYFPHVSLLRKTDCSLPLPIIAPIKWSVRDFVLVASVLSEYGPTYEIIGRWPLLATL